METLSLIALAITLLLAGCGVTVAMLVLFPLSILERAQQHGRFAGLGSPESGGGSGRALVSGSSVELQGTLHAA